MLSGYDLEGLIRMDHVAFDCYRGVISAHQGIPDDRSGFYIVNTGHLDGPGEHWTCLYFDCKGGCTYWDSYGNPPPIVLRLQLADTSHNHLRYQGPFSLLCGLYAVFYACRRSGGHDVSLDLTEGDFDGNDKVVCDYFASSIRCSL